MATPKKKYTPRKRTGPPADFPLQLAARFAEHMVNLAEQEQNRDLPGVREKYMLKVALGEAPKTDRFGADGLTDRWSKFCNDVYTYLKLYSSTGIVQVGPLCQVLEAAAQNGQVNPTYDHPQGLGDRMGAQLRKGVQADEGRASAGDLLDPILASIIPMVDAETAGAIRENLMGILGSLLPE